MKIIELIEQINDASLSYGHGAVPTRRLAWILGYNRSYLDTAKNGENQRLANHLNAVLSAAKRGQILELEKFAEENRRVA